MKTIKDPVHGYIQVEPELLPLLDSPEVQRLRHIRQLGFSFLVYPGAHHTRFEHSLGTMHLASHVSRQIDLSREEHLLVTSSALLHDIGHGPFSHAIEGLVSEILGREHTDVSDLLYGPSLGPILENIDLNPQDVADMISGTHPLASIIHGELDVDRMDYLLRDAHYTGVPYGTVDAMRLIRATKRVDGRIILHESGIQAAESLLIARTLMRPSVYYHHVSRIAEKMFASAVYHHISSDPVTILTEIFQGDDAACMQKLLHSDNNTARQMAEDLYNRRLYKRALYVGRDEVFTAFRLSEESRMRERETGDAIASQADVSSDQVLMDIPAFPREMWMEIQVQDRNLMLPLEDVSPLVTTLNETRRRQWRLGVYAPKMSRDAVHEAAREMLHVRHPTRQERLI